MSWVLVVQLVAWLGAALMLIGTGFVLGLAWQDREQRRATSRNATSNEVRKQEAPR